MKISDNIPKTVDEAIESIFQSLKPSDIDFINSNTSSSIHFGTGMHIRNKWKLWDETSPIKEDFKTRFNLNGCADDISGTILSAVWAKAKNENVEETINKEVEKYREHWKKEK